MRRTATRLADGRELIYYDLHGGGVARAVPDLRPLDPVTSTPEVRRDPLLGDSVVIAAHRQARTYH
ncbi:galactose-1-phosphate uridylyltransferase, partial [Streptomyces sp. UNOC14_S4]|nr:galactose-1-phosphate uridylyltransferase [Streptomyces sp. UNOC14_S4]